jgi:hypothetical protein
MAKPDPRIDSYDRKWNRELKIVVLLVGLVILAGAVYTLMNGPRRAPGTPDTRPYVADQPVVDSNATMDGERR